MGRMKASPRYNVVSIRINGEELRHLENLMEKTHKSVSSVMREAIEFFAASHDLTKAGSPAA